jgi:hypothetical protein
MFHVKAARTCPGQSTRGTKQMALQFKSDSDAMSLRILDAETGEDISKKFAIAYGGTVKLDQMVTAQVELLTVELDVVAEQTIWGTKHPLSGEFTPIRAIEFHDGTRVDFANDGTPAVTPLEPCTEPDHRRKMPEAFTRLAHLAEQVANGSDQPERSAP